MRSSDGKLIAGLDRKAPTSLPLCASHNLTVRSWLADASTAPSRLTAKATMPSVCPERTGPGAPVAAFQRRTVPSQLAEANHRPSGKNSSAVTSPVGREAPLILDP